MRERSGSGRFSTTRFASRAAPPASKHAAGIVLSNRPLAEDCRFRRQGRALLAVPVRRRRVDRTHQVRFPRPEDAHHGGKRVPRGAASRASISRAAARRQGDVSVLARGDTTGVVPVESGGMRKMVTQLGRAASRTDRGARALPSGAIDSGMDQDFISASRQGEGQLRAPLSRDILRRPTARSCTVAGDADRARLAATRWRRRQPPARDGQEEKEEMERSAMLPRGGHTRKASTRLARTIFER